jgi:hypothetical protein
MSVLASWRVDGSGSRWSSWVVEWDVVALSGAGVRGRSGPHVRRPGPGYRQRVEVGTDTYQVSVTELAGEERDRVFEEQARRYPGFAGYAQKTAGIRTIPVLPCAEPEAASRGILAAAAMAGLAPHNREWTLGLAGRAV